MIVTQAVLGEYDQRRAMGYSIPLWMIDAFATMCRSHPAITVPGGKSSDKPAGNLCTFPECQCVKACSDYVRARG